MKKTKRGHHFTPAHQQETAWARARSRQAKARENPGRYEWSLRNAVEELGWTVHQLEAEFWSDYAQGKRKNYLGGPMWVDLLVIAPNGQAIALDVQGVREYSARYENEKRQGLRELGIPYCVVPRGTMWDMRAFIGVWYLKLKKGMIEDYE